MLIQQDVPIRFDSEAIASAVKEYNKTVRDVLRSRRASEVAHAKLIETVRREIPDLQEWEFQLEGEEIIPVYRRYEPWPEEKC